jgi:branched-chain amino acid transport system permease protein
MLGLKIKQQQIDISQIIIWSIGFLLIAGVLVGAASTLMEGKYSSKQWMDFVVFGMAQGAIYALIALGYTMVYGVLGLINFAHGEVFMSGAFSAYFLADFLNENRLAGMAFVETQRGELSFLESHPIMTLLAIALFAAFISTVVAIVLEWIAYRPIRESPRLVKLITAIGASFFLQYTFRGMFGSGVKVYPDFDILDGEIFGIEKILIIVFISAILMLGLLYAFIQGTRTGRAIRAVSEDLETATLMGVNVDRTIAITFGVGGFMAGIAGVLYALIFSQVNFFMGFVPGIKAFTAAVLGGIGNLPGAAIGGLFLGIFESVGPTLILEGLGIPAAHQLKDVIAFTLLVLVLIFRPTGILGERLATKRV